MTEQNKELVRRYIEKIINTGDVSRIEPYLGNEYAEMFEGKRYPIGIEGAKEHVHGVRQVYPDLTLTVDHQIAEGEWVATSITARGTHKGTWMGIKPTGRLLTYTGVNINRVVNGKIVEHGGAANMLAPLLEAGALTIVSE